MRRRITTLLMSLAVSVMLISAQAQNLGNIRVNARFLTDRMAYELNLDAAQRNAIFEINFDFLSNIEPYVYDLAYADAQAWDYYYHYLDQRNDDLRWVLSSSLYTRFLNLDYFYRPVYARNSGLYLSIYTVYSNRKYFYYDCPSHYRTYNGMHNRRYYSSGYYRDYYEHRPAKMYHGDYRVTRMDVRKYAQPVYRTDRRDHPGYHLERVDRNRDADNRSNTYHQGLQRVEQRRAETDRRVQQVYENSRRSRYDDVYRQPAQRREERTQRDYNTSRPEQRRDHGSAHTTRNDRGMGVQRLSVQQNTRSHTADSHSQRSSSEYSGHDRSRGAIRR